MTELIKLDNKQTAFAELAESVLKKIKAKGATAAEVSISAHNGLGVTVRNAEVETVEFNQDKGIGITVYYGQKKGSASTTDIELQSIDKTIEAASGIAEYTQEDPHAGLADKALITQQQSDLALYHPWALTSEHAIELAKTCEAAGRNVDGITNSEGASVNTSQSVFVYGNSHGFIGGYPTTRHSISCALIGEKNGVMQRDYDFTVSRKAENLWGAETIGKAAADKTIKRLGARKIATQTCPVLFIPEMARTLWRHLFSAMGGGAIYRQSSFLINKLDTQILPDFVCLEEKPHLPGALGSAPFDGEGVATVDRFWIQEGVLKSYVLNSYTARQLGMKTTGNAGGIHNILVGHTNTSFELLLKQMNTGLIVTEMMGHGVNTVTGDYSRGATGFWVEGGNIQYPVEEITIAGNLKDMYQQIIAIGKDIDKRGVIQTGSVLIENMAVAGS